MFDLIGSCIKLENGELECYICGAKQTTKLSQIKDVKISKEDAEFCNKHAKVCFEDYHELPIVIQQKVIIEVDHRYDESKEKYKRTHYYANHRSITTGEGFQNILVGNSIPRFIALKWAKEWKQEALGPSWLQDEDLIDGLESIEDKKVKNHKTGLTGEITFTDEIYHRGDDNSEEYIEITWSNKKTTKGQLRDKKFEKIEILDPDNKTVYYEYRIKIETTTIDRQPPFIDSLK